MMGFDVEFNKSKVYLKVARVEGEVYSFVVKAMFSLGYFCRTNGEDNKELREVNSRMVVDLANKL